MTTRRTFLELGASAFVISSASKLFGAGAASNTIRMAVIGCREDGRGYRLLKLAAKIPGIVVTVVCDPDSRAMECASDWLVKNGCSKPAMEKDFRKVIERKDVDAVISATPDHFHAYSAVMAMRAGLHVYVEKPCAFCLQELEIIRRVQKETNKVFQQGSQRRSGPAFIKAVDEIKSKKLIGEIKYAKSWYNTARKPIGKGKVVPVPKWLDWDLWQGPAPRTDFRDNIVHYNWHWFRRWGTGECGNNQVHFIDISRWLLDVDFPEEVVSTGGKYFMPPDQDWEWPDVHTATYKFPGNKIITWEGTCCVNSNPYMGLSTAAMVYGDNGSVLFTPGGSVVLYDPKGTVVKEWIPDGVSKDKQITNTDNRSGAGWLDATGRHIENFADAIRAADPLAARAHADIGTKSTFLSLAANVAQTTGETLKICPTTGKLLSGGEAAKLWSREYEKGWELV